MKTTRTASASKAFVAVAIAISSKRINLFEETLSRIKYTSDLNRSHEQNTNQATLSARDHSNEHTLDVLACVTFVSDLKPTLLNLHGTD